MITRGRPTGWLLMASAYGPAPSLAMRVSLRRYRALTSQAQRGKAGALIPMLRYLLALFAVACWGLAGCGGSEPRSPVSEVGTTSAATREVSTPAAPNSSAVSLRAPSAGVDQELASGGLTDGVINPDRGDLVWFDGYDRVEPGQIGTAVLAAHVTYEGDPDVFSDPDDVAVGDPIRWGMPTVPRQRLPSRLRRSSTRRKSRPTRASGVTRMTPAGWC